MGGRDIGNIVELVKNDFKTARSNPIVIITLIGIIILPSLYAVINIDACWDPYEKTGDMEFAIANMDNGTVYEGYQMNVGDDSIGYMWMKALCGREFIMERIMQVLSSLKI